MYDYKLYTYIYSIMRININNIYCMYKCGDAQNEYILKMLLLLPTYIRVYKFVILMNNK
jgi:hypothetical protein